MDTVSGLLFSMMVSYPAALRVHRLLSSPRTYFECP